MQAIAVYNIRRSNGLAHRNEPQHQTLNKKTADKALTSLKNYCNNVLNLGPSLHNNSKQMKPVPVLHSALLLSTNFSLTCKHQVFIFFC